MVEDPGKTLRDIVRHVGRYPEEAFLFVREGLSFAAERVHGPETDAHRFLQTYLLDNELDWDDLMDRHEAGTLPESVSHTIAALGGCDKLNRHVGGREFCWALRDYAIHRWGILARTVLESWRIRTTTDFGHIVFGFIDFDLMRKQAEDRLEDFQNVYDFDEAFKDEFRCRNPRDHTS